MTFPETIPRDDMDLFLNECRLAGAQYFADKRRRRVLLRFEENWTLYMRYNGSYHAKEALPDRIPTEMVHKVCRLWMRLGGAVTTEDPATQTYGRPAMQIHLGRELIEEYVLEDEGYWRTQGRRR